MNSKLSHIFKSTRWNTNHLLNGDKWNEKNRANSVTPSDYQTLPNICTEASGLNCWVWINLVMLILLFLMEWRAKSKHATWVVKWRVNTVRFSKIEKCFRGRFILLRIEIQATCWKKLAAWRILQMIFNGNYYSWFKFQGELDSTSLLYRCLSLSPMIRTQKTSQSICFIMYSWFLLEMLIIKDASIGEKSGRNCQDSELINFAWLE